MFKLGNFYCSSFKFTVSSVVFILLLSSSIEFFLVFVFTSVFSHCPVRYFDETSLFILSKIKNYIPPRRLNALVDVICNVKIRDFPHGTQLFLEAQWFLEAQITNLYYCWTPEITCKIWCPCVLFYRGQSSAFIRFSNGQIIQKIVLTHATLCSTWMYKARLYIKINMMLVIIYNYNKIANIYLVISVAYTNILNCYNNSLRWVTLIFSFFK